MSDSVHGYRTKTVCELTGVARNTLLAWERRYGFISPARSPNGYRIYSELDLRLIREIKAYVDRGWAVSDAIRRSIGDSNTSEERSMATERGPLVGHEALLEALLAFDREGAEAVIAQVATMPFETLIAEYFSPVLRRIGVGWASGDYSVAQEHFASGFVREQLVAMLLRLGNGPVDGRRLVCCTHPEDPHELGLMMFAIRMTMRGWRITWLGARMPEQSLIDYLNEHKPEAVCISVTVTQDVEALMGFADRVRNAVDTSVDVILGGPATRDLPAIAGVRYLSGIDRL
jgi:MerR family transcriptional regulator, light-induced transcriptional regulator